MRRKGAILACVGLALLAGGCNVTENNYIREGIGTEIYVADAMDTAVLQDTYIAVMCRQAGLDSSPGGDVPVCAIPALGSPSWMMIVQAGMNDIDRRCDAWLTWLDNKARWTGPIHQQILHTQSALQAILGYTLADPVTAINIAGAVFGFASNTFSNFNNRLLFQLEKSTVQGLVLQRQQDYRGQLPRLIDNRPAAIYALRQYLRLCMPITIETQVNTTVKIFESGGPQALAQSRRMIDGGSVNTAVAVGPAPRDRIAPPPPPPPQQTLPAYADIILGYQASLHTIPRIEPILRKLCVPQEELRAISPRINALIQVYQLAAGEPVTGKLTRGQLAALNGVRDCATASFKNYYEANLLPGGVNTSDTVTALNLFLPANQKIAAGASIADVRARIPEVRNAVASSLTIRSQFLSDQLTSDMMTAVFKRGL
jgi:hypothetical protein